MQDGNGDTPLIVAARNGNVEIFKMLHEGGATINFINSQGISAFAAAKSNQSNQVVDYIYSSFIEAAGDSPLMWAVNNFCLEMVKDLFDHGADIHQIDKDGNNALILALKYGRKEIADYLLHCKNLENLETQVDKTNALVEAARKGYSDIVEELLERGMSVDAQDQYGYTALMCAAQSNDPKTFEMILKKILISS